MNYNDKAPWPTDPDGGDVNDNPKSLSHKNPDAEGANYGNDVTSWESTDPNPGQ